MEVQEIKVDDVLRNINGALPDPDDPRDRKYAYQPLTTLAFNPNNITDWSKFHGDAKDQGTGGYCVGFGSASGIESYIHKKTGKLLNLSEKMIYKKAQHHDEWDGVDYSGTSVKGAMKALYKYGVCRDDLWPYVPNYETNPDPFYSQDASRRRVTYYSSLAFSPRCFKRRTGFKPNRYGICPTYLKMGLNTSPVITSFMLTHKFGNTGRDGVVLDTGINQNAKHCMATMHYDNRTDRFKVLNSWGGNFADGGYIYLESALYMKMIFSAWVFMM